MQTIGFDFGTTNSVLALPTPDGTTSVMSFGFAGERLDTFRTALSFRRNPQPGGLPLAEAGPWAIRDFLEMPEQTRFLQSFKSFAGSSSFTDTSVFSRRYSFERLLETFLVRVYDKVRIDKPADLLVIGRPVRFAGPLPDDGLAMQRYEAGLRAAGFENIAYVLEPVAAAYFYAQRLKHDSVVLIGDFGGGTSDFSILSFRLNKSISATALAHGGIGIAGDSFDYRIIENVVTPRLGRNARYVSWGKSLPIPVHYFASFARWNELCLMRRPEILRELRGFARTATPKGEIEALIELIEGGVSYDLYRIVGQTKAQLSAQEFAEFRYVAGGIDIQVQIARHDFERWIAADLAKIADTVDRVVAEAGVTARDIDKVFLTGGTSHVPAVRKIFEQRFPAGKIDTGEQLLSIARGLALIGASREAQEWAVAS